MDPLFPYTPPMRGQLAMATDMEDEMERNEVEQIIATYTNDMLPLWADKWSRWPVPGPAHKIAARLRESAAFWTKQGMEETADALLTAAETILARAAQ